MIIGHNIIMIIIGHDILIIIIIIMQKCHIQDTRGRGILLHCRDAVGVFYSPSQLNWLIFVFIVDVS